MIDSSATLSSTLITSGTASPFGRSTRELVLEPIWNDLILFPDLVLAPSIVRNAENGLSFSNKTCFKFKQTYLPKG